MQTTNLTFTNAPRAAEFLMFLDCSAIIEQQRANAYRYAKTLKQTLINYQLILQKPYSAILSQQTRIGLVKKVLISLLCHTKCLTQILTPKAQQELAAYLANPTAFKPSAKALLNEKALCYAAN